MDLNFITSRLPNIFQTNQPDIKPQRPTAHIHQPSSEPTNIKSFEFLSNLSKLNYLFPSLVETEFLQPDFKYRKNINFKILKKVKDLELAKEVAKNYYLWLQVFDVAGGANPAGIRDRLSEFLGLSTTNNIYHFNIVNSDLSDFIIRGLQEMFPDTFDRNKSLDANSEQIVILQNERNISQGNYYHIDKIGRLIESLVVTEFAKKFNTSKETITSVFIQNKYNINATYYEQEYNKYIQLDEDRRIAEGNAMAKKSKEEPQKKNLIELKNAQKKQHRKIKQLITFIQNTGNNITYDDAQIALLENGNDLDATKRKLVGVVGGQYYRKRKTRKPKKTRKPRKTQRK